MSSPSSLGSRVSIIPGNPYTGGHVAVADFGIRLVHSGKRDTLCGDDPSVCAPDTAKSLDLANSAIEFFAYGEASTIFYWDKAAKRFRDAPISD